MRRSILLPALFLLFAIGCATPEARIERHAELFASLSPEAQQDIRDGIVKLGQSTDTVFLAIGRADHVQTRVEPSGITTIWRYTAVRWQRNAHVWSHRRGPWWHDPPYWDDSEEYDVLRVEFRDAKVVAIEHIER